MLLKLLLHVMGREAHDALKATYSSTVRFRAPRQNKAFEPGGAHFYQRMAQMRTSNPDQSQLMFLAFDLLYRCVDVRGLPGIPSAVLRQMRQLHPLFSYLAGTPKLGRLDKLDQQLLGLPWHAVRDG